MSVAAKFKGGIRGGAFIRRARKSLHAGYKVGLPKNKTGGDTYPDGTSVSFVAMLLHFGVEEGGEWPFMLLGANDHIVEDRALRQKIAKLMVEGKVSADKASEMLGMKVVGRVQKKMVDLRDPPNKPATIAKKGSSNPTIDTGRLRQSITWDKVKK